MLEKAGGKRKREPLEGLPRDRATGAGGGIRPHLRVTRRHLIAILCGFDSSCLGREMVSTPCSNRAAI